MRVSAPEELALQCRLRRIKVRGNADGTDRAAGVRAAASGQAGRRGGTAVRSDGLVTGHAAAAVGIVAFRRCRHRYDLLIPPAFELVLAEVHCRGREPGTLVPIVFKGDLSRHGADEYVLGAILCVLWVFHKRVTDAINRLHMPSVK